MVDVGEECDDGNLVDGDGCSSACTWEVRPIAMPGGSISMTGMAPGNWERVDDSCMTAVGTHEQYFKFTIVNQTGDDQRLRVRATTEEARTAMVVAYAAPFNEASPETNCLVARGAYMDVLHPSLHGLGIQDGETLVIVVTSLLDQPLISPPLMEIFTADRVGDGVVGLSEACDDGNTDDGDGCSASGTLELGWSCPTPGSACVPNVCGDGVRGGGEACDDGNEDDGDGCSATCEVEDGFACPVAGEACRPIVCGDGFIDAPETCDDAGPGCDASCQIEFVDTQNAEKSLPFGVILPTGRWATRIMDQQPWVYTFDALAGVTYEIDVFLGAPYACIPANASFYPTTPYAIVYAATGSQAVASDDGGPLGCPHVTLTSATDHRYYLWVYVDGPPSTDPMYVWIR